MKKRKLFEPWRFIWEIDLTYHSTNLLSSYAINGCNGSKNGYYGNSNNMEVRTMVKESKKVVDLQKILKRTRRKMDYWYEEAMRLREENDRLIHLLNDYRLLPMRYTQSNRLLIKESEEKRSRYNEMVRAFGIVKSASYEI